MTSIGQQLALGLALSLAIAGIAYWRRALSGSGVVGAAVVGTAIFGLGGWVRGGLLVAFFVSSSLLSRYRERQKEPLAEKFAKGSRRDLAQTLANGGLAALLALLIAVSGRDSPLYPLLAFAFYGALATVNADTWATELGVLARSQPRLITNGRPVPVGTSGGVTVAGTLAALAGALFIGLAGFVLTQGAALVTTGSWLWADWVVIPVAGLSGLAGALFDSLLGATVQAIYFCAACGKETERPIHRCGQRTRLVRGCPALNNDGVNFSASAAGALVALLLAGILF